MHWNEARNWREFAAYGENILQIADWLAELSGFEPENTRFGLIPEPRKSNNIIQKELAFRTDWSGTAFIRELGLAP